MNIIRYPQPSEWQNIVTRPHLDVSQLNNTVAAILKDIKENGDSAVMQYEEKFDHAHLDSLLVGDEEFAEARTLISDELYDALVLAHNNIEAFHAAQKHTTIWVRPALGWPAGRRA